MPLLLVDLAIIVVAARSLGALARRFGQPAVIGEIVAGILLGPTVLGRLAPGLPERLFPPDVPLRALADLGLVFFMFLVGLELDPRLIRQEGRRALAISLGGLVTPFALGALIAVPLLALNNGGQFLPGVEGRPTQLAFSLFMGAAMCVTAFPVLARILVERGLYRSRLGTSALCAAAVDDVIAWILLAAVVGLTRTGSAAEAGRAFLLAGGFVALAVGAGRPALGLLARRHEAAGGITVDQVAVVVVALLASAWITEWIGIHSIFGAFVLGTIMPRESRLTRELADRVEDFTVVVLLPVFFTVAGLRTNLFALGSPQLLVWTLVIVGAAVAGKLAGCGIAARLNGYSRRDALVLGTLMNTRGLTELVILSIGLGLGVLSDRTFAMMVVMALATTLMAAPIIRRIMPRREMVRVLSGGDPEPLASRVLVALGNPRNAPALVSAGLRLLGGRRPAELVLVRLVPTPRAPEFRTGLLDEEREVDAALEDMAGLARQAGESGVGARTVSFLSDNVGEDLADIAGSQRCDAVLLGWHHASLDLGPLRAMVQRVLSRAPCDVLVLVDRRGAGLAPESGPTLVARVAGAEDAGVRRAAERLAAGLGSDVREVDVRPRPAPARASTGVVQRLSARLTMRTSSARLAASEDEAAAVEPAVRESASAAALVVGIGTILPDDADFDYPASPLVALAACPVLLVRPGAPAAVAMPPARVTLARGAMDTARTTAGGAPEPRWPA
ncbi:MAG: cation:proton antiporter [Gemmatimonadaceae bacterium]